MSALLLTVSLVACGGASSSDTPDSSCGGGPHVPSAACTEPEREATACDPSCPSLAEAGVGIHACTTVGQACDYGIACLTCDSPDGGSPTWTYYDESCAKLGR